MKRLLVILLLMVVSPLTLSGETIFHARLIGVSDGDTLTVLDESVKPYKQHKVRLYGIDAPEKKQAFGTKSKEMLWKRITMYSPIVNVEIINRDRYGRLVGIVWACKYYEALGWRCDENGRSVNEDMIDYGMAWAYTSYLKKAHKAWYTHLEAGARLLKSGLWADNNPVPPWEFRKQKKHKK